jgi:hypothetical protein
LPALTPAEVESTTASGFFDIGTKGEPGRRQPPRRLEPAEAKRRPQLLRQAHLDR